MKTSGLLYGCLLLILAWAWPGASPGQEIARFGMHSISKATFQEAFAHSNPGVKPTDSALRKYLDLYLRFRLKVQAAYDLRLDTLASLKADLQNFRNQIADTYLNDQAVVNQLVDEAFARSQKDIHLGHLYVAFPGPENTTDTAKAWSKAMAAWNALQQGRSLADVADAYSDEPMVHLNHGDLHFITVFSLPYAMETRVYGLRAGQWTKPFRTKGGYHILVNLGERKAIGRIRVAQILLSYPPQAGSVDKQAVRQRADSLYAVLLAGGDFASLARQFSGDNSSYLNGGQIPEFGVGKYEPAFEEAAFALGDDGVFSPPVETSLGYHLLRRISYKPVSDQKTPSVQDGLRQQVSADARMEVAKTAMMRKILLQTGFKELPFVAADLWAYSDSALKNSQLGPWKRLEPQTPIFILGGRTYRVKDFNDYRQTIRNVAALTKGKSTRMVLDLYEQNQAFEHYRSHLEKYNPEFAAQLQEFKEGNLLFEIMQRNVWQKAAEDSLGQQKYYEEHRDAYRWEKSVDALLFYCSKGDVAAKLMLLAGPQADRWREALDTLKTGVQVDSGRFEASQVPVLQGSQLGEGRWIPAAAPASDSAVSLAFVVKRYPEKTPRTFSEARGMVSSDYQNFLEEAWIAQMVRKYPIRIQEDALRSLSHSGEGKGRPLH